MANRVVVSLSLLYPASIMDIILSYFTSRRDTTYIFTSAIVTWTGSFWLWKILCNRVLVYSIRPTMSEGQPGLLSSVLGYLSREVQDFVTTATGGSTSSTDVSVPLRYLSRLFTHRRPKSPFRMFLRRQARAPV